MTHHLVLFSAVAVATAILLPTDEADTNRTFGSVMKSEAGSLVVDHRTMVDDRTPRAVELRDHHLVFSNRFSLTFQRTLRIPDDGREYPLPPGLGSFPLYPVRDFRERVPAHWDIEHGYILPMHQREAMWIDFDGAYWKPNAVKVGVGLVNAVSGTEWNLALGASPQDYLVVPDQPWLDGIKSGEGTIRQFVAVPLGTGYTVEAQVTGKESDGALRIAVFEPKPGRFPDQPPEPERDALYSKAPALAQSLEAGGMGIGAGGTMRQKVYEDAYGVATWSVDQTQEVVIYIVNSAQFESLTGITPPPTPIDAATYTAYGFPWFDLYDEHKKDLHASEELKKVKSTGQLDKEKDLKIQDDSSVIVPDSQVIKLK
ncbi:MAG: hypothetical protein RBU27_13675 [Bacteroidota bacterium]|jgi:hypothetical protein|nr:hypothetical protein [Bacteroidota bacterium]